MDKEELKHELETQDNRCTSHVYFIVEELVYEDGIVEEYAEHMCFCDEDGGVIARECDAEFAGLSYLYDNEQLPELIGVAYYRER